MSDTIKKLDELLDKIFAHGPAKKPVPPEPKPKKQPKDKKPKAGQ